MSSLYSTAVHEAAHAVIAVHTARGRSHGLAKNGVVTIDKDGDTLGSIQIKNSGTGRHRYERRGMVLLAGGIGQHRIDPQDPEDLAGNIAKDTEQIIRSMQKLHPSQIFRDAANLLYVKSESVEIIKQAAMRGYFKNDAYRIAHTELFISKIKWAIAIMCAEGNDVKAVQCLMAYPNSRVGANVSEVIQAPWFKTLGELTNRTSALLDKHWREIHMLANHLLEVGTMTGPEAEQMIRIAA